MDETCKEYILQWSGHAASITERFSGLLARQALVDVTLICQEQKLRVHKLVLASCSLYFEEMLEQDLGQEPIILLKDLDFDILKAMVEFMYCGETTIAHCHLQSLLNAAKIFRVKDLESIVKGMMESNYIFDNRESSTEHEELTNVNSSISERNCVQVKLGGKESNDKPSSMLFTELFEDTSLKYDQTVEQTSLECIDDDNGEAPSEVNNSTNAFTNQTLQNESTGIKCNFFYSEKENSNVNLCSFDNKSVDKDFKSMSDDCSVPHSTQSNELGGVDVASGVGECLKVYTHKKRKSINNKNVTTLNMCDIITQTDTTDNIDLSDDLSCDNTNLPINLPSIVDVKMLDNVWCGLSNDNINVNQASIFTSDRQRNSYDEINNEKLIVSNYKSIRQIKEIFSVDNDNLTMEKTPILRRSVRLNQAEDDTMNNNSELICQKSSEKSIDLNRDSLENNIKSLTKTKRKIKESEARISDENIASSQTSKKTMNKSRSLRSAAKIKSKRNNTSRCSLSKITRHESKTRASKLKNVKMEKIDSLESGTFIPPKLNTIATVDRALWGDMSDILENHKDATSIPKYSLSKEIPFAVGLLPLHAALERMQAIPDYQPRKTRSSFAPLKQDSNGLKRKSTVFESESFITKKHCSPDRVIDTTSAGCHIEIQTSSQCRESRTNLSTQLKSQESSTDKR